MTAPSPWMTVPEVAAYARMGRTEILTALNDESLRGHQTKPGGKWRVHVEDVDAYLRGEVAEPIRTRVGRAS